MKLAYWTLEYIKNKIKHPCLMFKLNISYLNIDKLE